MKKLLFLSAIGIAGFMSASNTMGNDPIEKSEIIVEDTECMSYDLTPSCLSGGDPWIDTVCWDAGDTGSFIEARNCMNQNILIAEQDQCGGLGGPQDPSFDIN